MKKILLILALALATALPSVAETVRIEGAEPDTEAGLPVDFGYIYSASQSLYTPADLMALPNGISEAADIKSISASLSLPGATWLWSNYDFKVTLYVKEIDATEFAQTASKAYIPFEFTDAPHADFTISDLEGDLPSGWADASYGGEADCIMNFDFDTPIHYSGKSLLLTYVCHILADGEVNGSLGDPAFNSGRGVTTLKWGSSKEEITTDAMLQPVSNTLQKSDYLPVIDIDYDVVPVASEPSVERLPDTDFAVGPYDKPSIISAGRTEQVLPVELSHAYSGSQTLYTPAQLDGLTGVNQNAEISEISFKVNVENDLAYFCSGFNVKCYVTVLDNTTAFNKTGSGDLQWFKYSSEDAKGVFSLDFATVEEESTWGYAYYYGMGDLIEVTIPLDKPVEIGSGQSLLITWVSEVEGNQSMWTISTAGFDTGGAEKLAMNMASDRQTFESYYNAGETNTQLTYNYLPVLKLHYTPLVYKDAEPKNQVSFESVVPMVRRMTVDPAISESTEYGVSDFKRIDAVNGVSLAYTIKDEQAGEGKQYEISLNNEPLATVSELSGIINFVDPAPKQDMRLMVTPTDANSVGLPTTVAKADIEALLPQYEVSVVKSKYYMTDGEGDKKNIHAAVKFQFGVPEDIMASVTVSSPTVASSRKLLHNGDVGDEYTIDFDPEFLSLDADNWSCLHLNDRCVSYFYPNVMEGSVESGELVVPNKSFYSSIDPTVTYELAWAGSPKVEEGAAAAFANGYDVDLALARELSIKEIKKTASNSGYNGVSFVLDPPQASDLSGIESVEVDGDADVEYFNLQGVRVENPQSGLFIRRQGNKAAKVYVK